MELLLKRTTRFPRSTAGDLFVDGALECHTLEDVVREIAGKPVKDWKIQNETAIPAGRYRVVINFSQRFRRNMIRLLEVPGFDGILMHTGNTDINTEGCVLVGQTITRLGIIKPGTSAPAYNAFFPKVAKALADGEDVWITVTNEALPAVA